MKIDARGKQCPLPVIEAKKALEQAAPGEMAEVLVDNEIAVQNLLKLAAYKSYKAGYEKAGEAEFRVWIESPGGNSIAVPGPAENVSHSGKKEKDVKEGCAGGIQQGTVVVLSSDIMGTGDETLGRLLMKGFVYAMAQQDSLPETIILYNGGARLSCQGSDSLNDLMYLAGQGVEVLTCGTCLNHYGLAGNLAVGSVTNMYEIVEKMTRASLLIRP